MKASPADHFSYRIPPNTEKQVGKNPLVFFSPVTIYSNFLLCLTCLTVYQNGLKAYSKNLQRISSLALSSIRYSNTFWYCESHLEVRIQSCHVSWNPPLAFSQQWTWGPEPVISLRVLSISILNESPFFQKFFTCFTTLIIDAHLPLKSWLTAWTGRAAVGGIVRTYVTKYTDSV